ncbi:hypothetical protein AAE478_005933 [Parahypoxylon ruwenzoriense]
MEAEAEASTTEASPPPSIGTTQPHPIRKLPRQCRGCGALSQTSQPNQPGYFDLGRKAVQTYLGAAQTRAHSRSEDQIYEDALKHLNREELEKKGVDVDALALSIVPTDDARRPPPKVPLCDRCHYILHNNTGESIFHPSLDAIRDTIQESPWVHNHVYHIIDAADFPMSLLPRLHELLDTMPLRSRNRRSRAGKFYHNKKTELSFIITRCDLLAPTKEQVDKLFPYLRQVLRLALGRLGRGVRLHKLRAVSSKLDWWTKDLKEEIWDRAGAGWMVGKANVGKSQLFQNVFPKGRMNMPVPGHHISINMDAKEDKEAEEESKAKPELVQEGVEDAESQAIEEIGEGLDEYSLLPPAPAEVNYPELPLVSALPGTTASPIRIPFGNGRGELIDLPGLERSSIEQHVQKEHRSSLVMRSRIVPTQMSVTPGRSLLVGGFIRMTPREPAPTMLAYSFTPIEAHVTRTDKAIAIQTQTGEVNVGNIALPGTGEKTKLAGSFKLKWDVTRQRSGYLTRRDGLKLAVDQLPYRVLSADILIEGVGWVEITAQVRARDLFRENEGKGQACLIEHSKWQNQNFANPEDKVSQVSKDTRVARKDTWREDRVSAEEVAALIRGDVGRVDRGFAEEKEKKEENDAYEEIDGNEENEPNWPVVDVYSPDGKFIAVRPPMNGWLLNKPRVTQAQRRSRPRRSMKGMKKREKKLRRESAATGASF